MKPTEEDGTPVRPGSAIAAFGLGMALVAGLCAFLSWGQHWLDARRYQESRALMVARVLAEAAAESSAQNAPKLQALTDALAWDVPGLGEAFVLKGTGYVAHSDQAKAGQRLSPSSIEDKALYDKSRRLQNAFNTNRKALEENPELGRKVAEEIEVDGGGQPVQAAVPVVAEDRVLAMVQVSLQPAPAEAALPWLQLVLVALVATALFAAVRSMAPSLASFAAVALAALAVVVSLRLIRTHAQRDYLGLVEGRAHLAAGIARAFKDTGRAEALGSELLGAIGIDRDGGRYGELLHATAAEGEVSSLVQQFETGSGAELSVRKQGWEIGVSRDALRSVFDRHGRSLRVIGVATFLLVVALYFFVAAGVWGRIVATLRQHAFAYAYTVPAMVGMLVLVFVPFCYGVVLGFMRQVYNVWIFAGFENFAQILFDFGWKPRNFYFTFGVTVMWTVLNVSLHVIIGLCLALLLQDKMLKMRALYRVLLVVPWAVPNYITALIWQGMFHKEFGAINHYLGYVDAAWNRVAGPIGLDPIALSDTSWFSSFWTAFAANLATNTWLGFPFMMVISLGALQSIPTDLYEAADVDGATKWQQFRTITLPLLKPALFPAIILGTIWTFNQFNIIYLVSAGQPANSTDILIVEAYRKAFENYNYGGAAAYSTIIFVILLSYTLVTNRWTRATAGAFE
jgi:arabinogalactan oligomer/maltooligosaccharide transport system permease protein